MLSWTLELVPGWITVEMSSPAFFLSTSCIAVVNSCWVKYPFLPVSTMFLADVQHSPCFRR